MSASNTVGLSYNKIATLAQDGTAFTSYARQGENLSTYRRSTTITPTHSDMAAIISPEKYTPALYVPGAALASLRDTEILALLTTFPQAHIPTSRGTYKLKHLHSIQGDAALPYARNYGVVLPFADPAAKIPCKQEKFFASILEGGMNLGMGLFVGSLAATLGAAVVSFVIPFSDAVLNIGGTAVGAGYAGSAVIGGGSWAANAVWSGVRRLIGSNTDTIRKAFIAAAQEGSTHNPAHAGPERQAFDPSSTPKEPGVA